MASPSDSGGEGEGLTPPHTSWRGPREVCRVPSSPDTSPGFAQTEGRRGGAAAGIPVGKSGGGAPRRLPQPQGRKRRVPHVPSPGTRPVPGWGAAELGGGGLEDGRGCPSNSKFCLVSRCHFGELLPANQDKAAGFRKIFLSLKNPHGSRQIRPCTASPKPTQRPVPSGCHGDDRAAASPSRHPEASPKIGLLPSPAPAATSRSLQVWGC